ncbi:hypothetical protein FACS1894123_07780 [Bacteroidia bacterium]|nr:hypothetical protein FACS1894123_07780 [Bacteroidia bacterium]
MKRKFLKFALMSMVAVTAIIACDKDDDEKKETPMTITNVSPTEVAVGDEITITGTGLDQADAVGFGLSAESFKMVLKANFVSSSAESIKVIIPEGVTFPSGVAVATAIDATLVPWTDGFLTAKEVSPATQAQTDAFSFLLCSNNAYEAAGKNDQSPEYYAAIGACLQNSLTVAGLSFDAQGQPNNEYTVALYDAITQTVSTMYVGQTPEAIATSIAGIQYMIYSFYQGLQSAQ